MKESTPSHLYLSLQRFKVDYFLHFVTFLSICNTFVSVFLTNYWVHLGHSMFLAQSYISYAWNESQIHATTCIWNTFMGVKSHNIQYPTDTQQIITHILNDWIPFPTLQIIDLHCIKSYWIGIWRRALHLIYICRYKGSKLTISFTLSHFCQFATHSSRYSSRTTESILVILCF